MIPRALTILPVGRTAWLTDWEWSHLVDADVVDTEAPVVWQEDLRTHWGSDHIVCVRHP